MNKQLSFLPLVVAKTNSFDSAKTIADYFTYCATLPSPLVSVYRMVMEECGVKADDPIVTAGMWIAADVDSNIGSGDHNAYHNRQHFCEVLLCTIPLGRATLLTKREQALVHLAALIHDFHHDGKQNRTPFRLEKIALANAMPYLEKAGMSDQEQQVLSALILATAFDEGTAYARHCFEYHFEEGGDPHAITTGKEMQLLAESPSISLQAMVLIEADILPSIGLTIDHAVKVSERLEKEWAIKLSPWSKARFIEEATKSLKVSQFYLSNMRSIRDYYLDKS